MSEMIAASGIAEAVSLLEQGYLACAGATNLFVDRHHGKYLDRKIVSLHRLEELKEIHRNEDEIRIGSLVTLTQLEEAGLGILSQAASEMAGPQVRNRGTIGGNILSASPAADLVPVLMALDARLELMGSQGRRVEPIHGFMTGPGSTAIRPDELLLSISISAREAVGRGAFRKVGKRNALAISVVNAAVYMETEDRGIRLVRIALGSVGPAARRALQTEQLLTGSRQPCSEEEWLELSQKLRDALMQDISPISDDRATESYRRKVSGNIVCSMIRSCWEGEGR